MRTFNVTGFREVEVVGQHSHTGQPCPREQARVGISLQEVCCSCEIQLLDSKYLSSKAFQSHVLGDAMSALDHALETAFFLMTNDEIARVVVCLSGKLVNVSQDVSVTCIAHLRIEENSRPVYELTPADKLGIAMKYKNMGVSLYKEGLLHKQTLAFFVFSDAVKWLCMIPPDEDKDFLQEVMTVKMQCYNNIALFHLQHHNYNLCVVATTVVLNVDERNVKALYRRAVASTEMQNYEPAVEDLKAALLLDPNSKLLKRQQEVIKRKQKDLTDKYAVAMKKMFS
ncbi:peptidyl-prolyl cis-trans isomerase FKBP62-like [Portunus trituberculatus]|uniref:peptidyl-prolyl cis-trans isomerase FKBP62-like n=1 Tax=Portunus trituberculatus TaxID=210409 RepID=UPI001E1CC0B3|nr:peptidyl-prolyl cis-trans isomerase FKBP62-like [Portunus trituberculatus]